MRKLKRSKLGEVIDQKGITYQEFAEILFKETGYFMHRQNVWQYASGFLEIKSIKMAQCFAQALKVDVNDII
jgi:hypothetical protein